MIRIRPAKMEDLDGLEEMAKLSSGGITSFPADRRLLRERIEQSQFSFSKEVVRPKDESYLFVLEEKGSIGCSAINAQVGEPEAVWAFHLEHTRQHSEQVAIDKKIKMLTPAQMATGPSEVCTLFLHPDWRRSGLGRLLSLARFLFMALFPQRFGKEVVALFRGAVSSFWEEVMHPFFEMSFEEADSLRCRDPRFIADLVPRHPIYIPLLSSKARSAIGKAHHNTEPALKLLKDENFHFARHVDLFDAGPYYGANLAQIRTTRVREQARVVRITEEALHSVAHLVCNNRTDFRACYAHVHLVEGGAVLDAETAAALEIAEGETIWYAHPYEETEHAF